MLFSVKAIVAITVLAGFASPVLAEAPGTLAPVSATAALVSAVPAPGFATSVGATMVQSPIVQALPIEPAYHTVGTGMASYYGRELAGNRTASGERFDPSDLTAAHRTLPLGSKVRVTNPRTGDSVVVRINDRGPFHGNRLIDLSEAAARQVGIRAAGSGIVEIAVAGD